MAVHLNSDLCAPINVLEKLFLFYNSKQFSNKMLFLTVLLSASTCWYKYRALDNYWQYYISVDKEELRLSFITWLLKTDIINDYLSVICNTVFVKADDSHSWLLVIDRLKKIGVDAFAKITLWANKIQWYGFISLYSCYSVSLFINSI